VSVAIVSDDAAYDAALERVLTAAFGPGRFAKVSERVRERAPLDRALSRVALENDTPVGCCRIYRVRVGDAPMLFLGPLAVAPSAQGARLGGALVAAALDACAATSARGVIVVGQPRMFAPFGFVEIPKGRVTLPGPVEARRLQWRALNGVDLSALSGAVSAPRAAS
jgi:predicted N-acetyltransferase YhbS